MITHLYLLEECLQSTTCPESIHSRYAYSMCSTYFVCAVFPANINLVFFSSQPASPYQSAWWSSSAGYPLWLHLIGLSDASGKISWLGWFQKDRRNRWVVRRYPSRASQLRSKSCEKMTRYGWCSRQLWCFCTFCKKIRCRSKFKKFAFRVCR